MTPELYEAECVHCRIPAPIVAAGLCQRCIDAAREANRLAKDFETLNVEGAPSDEAGELSEEPGSWV